MKTILHIVGNRPQFIKLAVLYKELAGDKSIVQHIVHTGQHSSAEMSGIFFRDLAIPTPDINLEISSEAGRDHFIASAGKAIRSYLEIHKNPGVFVYGDTNTTLAAALAACGDNAELLHFEAGIRTGDRSMPEEINRILTDRMADVNYCCTKANYQTMLAEGYGKSIPGRVLLSGDLMYDAFLRIAPAKTSPVAEKNYVLCTIHRAANILSAEKLAGIVEGLNQLHKRIAVVMPVHPHTKKRLEEYGLNADFIQLPPVGYPEMKFLLQNASAVITDSGGTAREAFFCEKRSVVVMEKPFWPEILSAGCSTTAIANSHSLVNAFERLPSLIPDFQTPIFGSGQASQIIKEDILAHL